MLMFRIMRTTASKSEVHSRLPNSGPEIRGENINPSSLGRSSTLFTSFKHT